MIYYTLICKSLMSALVLNSSLGLELLTVISVAPKMVIARSSQ